MAERERLVLEFDAATEAAMIAAADGPGCPIVIGLKLEQYTYLMDTGCICGPPVPMLTARGMAAVKKLKAMPPRAEPQTLSPQAMKE